MKESALRRWSRLSIWRDSAGREVYAPWGRLSRVVFAIPTPEDRERIGRANQRFVVGWLVVLVVFAIATAPIPIPGWLGLVLGGLVLLHAHLRNRRLTRGMTPIPYVHPAA